MKYVVSWPKVKELMGKEVEVEAEVRWDAVVEAAVKLGIAEVAPMQQLFDTASVKKVGGPKRTREWRFPGGPSVRKGRKKKNE